MPGHCFISSYQCVLVFCKRQATDNSLIGYDYYLLYIQEIYELQCTYIHANIRTYIVYIDNIFQICVESVLVSGDKDLDSFISHHNQYC